MARLLLPFLLALCACAHGAYDRAKQADTITSWRTFLAEHPEGELAEAAAVRIEELEFEEAVRLHTVVAYKRFLEAHPDSVHARAAMGRLEGLRFNTAKAQGTALAWRQFLREHPAGTNREEAERRLAAAELDESAPSRQRSSASEVISAAMQTTSDEATRQKLEKQLDDARYEEARGQGAHGLLTYLRESPAGSHREAARVELLRLEVSGLLVSGLEADALVKLDGHPLGTQLEPLRAGILRSQAMTQALRVADVALRNAEVSYHLRAIDDLVRSLGAPDPLDRWQAAEELGHHVSIRAIDPLLDAVRGQRNPRVRQQAFDSLARVLRALPRELRDFEVATRLEALRQRAASADVFLAMAALLDFSGRRELAAAEYQKAFEPRVPDPIILRRWAEIRAERREAHSAAVAARQLSLWAKAQLASDETEGDSWTVAQARGVCASVEAARFASQVVQTAREGKSEFPEDLVAFDGETAGVLRLAEARLADVELALRARQVDLRPCGDAAVTERLASAEEARRAALLQLSARGDGRSLAALERARERDPASDLRRLAGSALERQRGEAASTP